MMNQNRQPIKYNDYDNHQWILKYGDVVRTIDFFKSDDYVKEIMNEMIAEHLDVQLEKILNYNDNNDN